MDELANSFSAFGQVVRSSYRNTYDRRTRSVGSYFSFITSLRIAREWQKLGVDFVHLNKQNLEDGLELLQAATRCGIPSLCLIHITQSARYLEGRFPWVRDLVARRALRSYPGLLVTVLESRRDDLLSFIGPSPRVRVVPTGVQMLDLSQREIVRKAKRFELGYDESVILFTAVGRMVPQKRPIEFLQEAESIYRKIRRARFLWVGDGPLTGEWDRWVASRGLTGVIQRVPWQADVPAFLFASDAFMHVAQFEGLPLAILEAMSAALPCVISKNLLSEMTFMNAENSIAIEVGSQWMKVLEDSEQLRQIGNSARTLVEKEFSFGRMAEAYELLYEISSRPKQ
jgi:glycosyltransferase involved in cell wall biosynthesis